MPRRARLVVTGIPHHVTQRGNYRQNVFEIRQDYQKYCYWASQYALEYRVDILAYCLMSNHVHFIVVPHTPDGLARFFNTTHMRYSQYKNKDCKRKGHLWQGRFYSSVLDGIHLLRAVRYVEQNPVRARIVKRPGDYIWSSAREHLGMERAPVLKTAGAHEMLNIGRKEDWNIFLGQEDYQMADWMREKTQKGGVLGTDQFIRILERRTGIVLGDRPVGRPSKNRALSPIIKILSTPTGFVRISS